ncbi:Uncharacterized conserved protein YqhQ [Dethiosulfatibacter aminovorans DSM 17477]|uniref:Uncharacterized conserved protein YqhQ n=2 Tax=Dethiosulfatibacter TaxID=448125 RepID=A0A1M6HJA9_9FIRM|nr:Uncharacterized conserved protein YqhQ [Dethiosulfatibacter aminovorans DSM 17477]
MRGPHKIATAVRKPDGEITVKTQDINPIFKSKFLKLPLVRGSVALVEAMIIGIKELMYSAEFYEDELEEDAFDRFLRKMFKGNADQAIIYFSVAVALLISVGAFIILPNLVAGLLKTLVESPLILNFLEGILRVGLFTVYVYLISKMDDIKRVFMYHGAEHKTIYAYENGEELTVENARKYITLHPRCGTSFLVNVLIISIIVFSFFGWPGVLMRIVTRLVMLPVIAGLSYEINRYIGKHENKGLAKLLAKPGFLFQKLTTKEPTDDMLEVAIAAMKEVIPENKEDDNW